MSFQLPETSVAETLAHKIAALKRSTLPAATSRKCEDLLIDVVGLCVTAQTSEKAGRKPLKEIKTMKDDAAAVEKEGESIKARYTKIFRV